MLEERIVNNILAFLERSLSVPFKNNEELNAYVEAVNALAALHNKPDQVPPPPPPQE